MSRFSLKRLPSPALVVAFVALIAALSGTAIALPGKNSVDSGDIKNGAVRGKDIRNNAVTGKKVKNNSLTGADVKGLSGGDVTDDSLSGSDVNEASLGKVPSAASADSSGSATTAGSVGGVTMRRIDFRRPDVGPEGPVTILNLGGLQLRAQCGPAGDQLDVTATTSVNDADLWGFGVDTAEENLVEENGFDVGEVVVIDINDETDVQQFLSYRTDAGSVVDVTLIIHDDFGATDVGCQVSGYATASS